MTDKDSNLTETLASEIENAVDDLFGRYELGQGGESKAAAEPETAVEPEAAASAEVAAPTPPPAAPTPTPAPAAPTPAPAAPTPAPAAPTPAPAAPTPAPAAPTPAPAAPTPPQPAAAAGADSIITEMEEAILTVDWEVNEPNVTKARSILDRLRNDLNLAGTPAEEVASLMDRVLQCMGEDPSAAPTSGPAHLKDGLAAIKSCVKNDGTPDREGRQLLVKAIQELQDSLPMVQKDGVLDLAADEEETSFTLELESAVEETAEEPLTPADIAVPIGMERVLREYAANIDRALKRLTPMNDLFGRTPGMEKLHKLTSRVQQNLKKLQEDNRKSFTEDFTRATGAVAASGDLSTFLNEHRSTLDYCVNRLLPMENLFEKNSGYEKLYGLTKKIRIRLEREQGALERAMGGDYEPALSEVMSAAEETASEETAARTTPDEDHLNPEVTKAINECIQALDAVEDGDLVDTLAAVAKAKKILAGILGEDADESTAGTPTATVDHETCPWPILMKTVWGGRTVAFAPEQVAYQATKKIRARKAAKISFFAIKTLKTSPWTNLQNLVSGELANEPRKVLKKMEVPVMRPPADFPGSAMKKQVMVILYQNGLGKACFLDAPMEPMDVPDEAQWQELRDTETGLAGILNLSGEEIPVYSI